MHTPKIAGSTFPFSSAALKRSWLALVAGTLMPCATWAQSAPSGAVYLKHSTFTIPIEVAPDKKDMIRELYLFVSTDRGRTWQKIQTAKPTDQSFTFRAQTDGEYWFTLAYVDKNDKMEPRDIRTEPPGLQVVVDKTPPSIAIETERDGDAIAMNWRVAEPQPDLNSLKIEVKADGESDWREVPIRKALEGEMTIPVDPGKNYLVRASMADRAGNVAEMTEQASVDGVASKPSPRKLEIEENGFRLPPPPSMDKSEPQPSFAVDADRSAPPSAARTIPTASTEREVAKSETPAPVMAEEMRPTPAMEDSFSPPAQPTVRQAFSPSVAQQQAQPAVFERAKPAQPASWPHMHANAVSNESHWMSAYATASRIPIASTQEQIQPAAATMPEPAAPSPSPKAHLSSSPRIEVNYSVRGAGPAGVGKVELWYTTDNGETWKLYGEDPDKTAPFEVVLPSEGRYGLQVVVTSLAGLGQRPPRPQDKPQLIIEVDSTPPTAELYQPLPDTQGGKDRLWLHWSSTDKHLADNPVSLYYAIEPNGELYPIQTDLPAEGRYSWQVPKNIPYQVYLVLIARDMANNIAKAVTPEPVVVDLSQPEAEVIGVVALPDENTSTR